MKLQDLFNTELATALGVRIGEMLPPGMGDRLARLAAALITRRKRSAMVRAVRANQWVVHDRQASSQQLDQLTLDIFYSTARSLYEFWHYRRDNQAVMDLVQFDPSFMKIFERARRAESGTLLVAPHMTNFDLVGRAVVLRGLNLQVLSYPQPPGGYRVQNALRELPGLRVTPMSIHALRQASETLNANGAILTGVDRPLPAGEEAKYLPCFFGQPAALPVFHIRLALKHKLPITVLGGCREPDGGFRVWASDPIPIQPHPDLVEETVRNAEAILMVAARFIRQAPTQWAMFYPVWPNLLDQAPA